jgi:branched-chain amino acid aminotransferase
MTQFSDISDDIQVWKNGEFVNWKDATVHIMVHALHYGSSVFEGIRCYKTPKGSTVWRFEEHMRRLYNSAKLYRMEIPFSFEELCKAALGTVTINKFEGCYIRPIVFRGTGPFGVLPLANSVDTAICCWEWGSYLGEEALEKGVKVCTSSWSRFAPNTIPAMAKCAANYANGQLIKMEAHLNGYAEGIALDVNGYVSEGSGENIFMVCKNDLLTPPLGNSVLPGITRDCVIKLAKEMGMNVIEQMIPREMLLLSDEVFFTGTAAEITPIASIDQIDVGTGKRGPVVKTLQEKYFAYINGEVEDTYGWHTYLYK